MAVDNDTKVRENRLRRKAARYGLHLSKSARRDPDATDHGLFALIDPRTGVAIHSALLGQFVHGWTLDAIEKYLLNEPALVRKSMARTKRSRAKEPTLLSPAADEHVRKIVWQMLLGAGLVSGEMPKPKPEQQ